MDYESPGFGWEYVRSEIKSAEQAGSTGWLLWNPSQDYSDAFQAIPRKPRQQPPPPPATPTSRHRLHHKHPTKRA
jgi:hypothetical protein